MLGTSLEGSGGTLGERNVRVGAEKAEWCQGEPFQKVVLNLGSLNCLNILQSYLLCPTPFNPFCFLMLKNNKIKAYFSVTVAYVFKSTYFSISYFLFSYVTKTY